VDKKSFANLALCALIGGLVIFALANIGSALTDKGLLIGEPVPSAEAAALLDKIVIIKQQIASAEDHKVYSFFQVENRSEVDVKNIKVLCEMVDEKGDYLEQKQWVLSPTLEAGTGRSFKPAPMKMFINSKAIGFRCRPVDLARARPPAFVLHRSDGGHDTHDGHGSENDQQAHGAHGMNHQ
jgi:hypothetical protein